MPELEAVGIVVSDIAESCRFYRLLGVEAGEPTTGEDHFETRLSNGLRLMWDSETLMRQIDGSWAEPVGQRVGLAFGCAGPAEVDATYARVLEAGFEGAAEPWDAVWGQRYARVIDPDGNKVDLFAPL